MLNCIAKCYVDYSEGGSIKCLEQRVIFIVGTVVS